MHFSKRTAIVSAVKIRYKQIMTFTRIPLLILMTSLASFITGCSGGAPYVYDSGEFNRESEVYRQGIKDRKDVTVCYSKRATTPHQVSGLAREECARFGKSARFREQSYNSCPLLTPVAAIFDCVQQTSRVYSSGFK